VVATNRDQIVMSNNAICAVWPIRATGQGETRFTDVQGGTTLNLSGDLFEILLADGTAYSPSNLVTDGTMRVRQPAPVPGAARLASRARGYVVELPMSAADRRLTLTWRALGTDGANYVRQEIDLTAAAGDCAIRSITWTRGVVPGARTVGQVDGSVVVAKTFFFGWEDPHALNQARPAVQPATATGGDASANAGDVARTNELALCELERNTVLKRGETLTVSFVVGVSPPGQLRRGFLYYLERERAHPYRPYLHYNSWYDIAWDPFALNETNCLEAIQLLGERFIKPYGVVMDGLVFDDGWDDPKSLWQFHQGFPSGFAPLAQLCGHYHTRLGVWLSPFGGYGLPKEKRLQFGHERGYETNAAGFSLAGARYYAAFKQACVGMIRNYRVNHFKFDGIATGMYAKGSGQYVLDTEAMRRLMLELRQEDPDLYINLTTGSWPSPFWLRYADSVWRQGGDMGYAGKGPKQQQWLTYRDQETYRNIVLKGPLFPLNSLMSQGVAYSRHGSAGDPTFNSSGFRDDVRAFFGSGTSLQELYIQPAKLSPEDWRVLAEAATWSRTNADVLMDTHWIGGDPGKSQIYGYASWSPRKGILMLRNPDDQPGEIALDAERVFELPMGAATSYTLKSPWSEDAPRTELQAIARQPIIVRLKPFEVVVLEAIPLSRH